MFAAPSVKYSQSAEFERVKPGGGGVPGSSVEVKSIAAVVGDESIAESGNGDSR